MLDGIAVVAVTELAWGLPFLEAAGSKEAVSDKADRCQNNVGSQQRVGPN